jgi:Met-zincin
LNDLAYSQGIGGYDKVAIDYGYRIFDQDDENPLLIKLIDDAERNGYTFLNDQVSLALTQTAMLAHLLLSNLFSSHLLLCVL